MNETQMKELLLQSLEHEIGGVKIYETALKCAQNEDLREEWERYHSETETHVRILRDVFSALQLNPEEASPGREIIREMGISLVKGLPQVSPQRPKSWPVSAWSSPKRRTTSTGN